MHIPTDTLVRLSIDAFVFAAALCALRIALVNGNTIGRLLDNARVRISVAAIVGVFTQLCVIWFRKSIVYQGRRIWFLDDDAMISMRYGFNLASGHGLVWNVGERVEGYTNFLWTCFMAGIHGVGAGVERASLVVLLANVALSITVIAALDRLGRRMGTSAGLIFASLILCAISRDIILWSTSGLETIAVATLVTTALPGVLSRTQQRGDRLLTCIPLALLPLLRSDAIVLCALLLATAFVVGADWRQLGSYCTFAIVPAAAHVAFRVFYYADWLPNTAYLKVTGSGGLAQTGLAYTGRFALNYVAVLIAATAAFTRLPSRIRYGLLVLLPGYVFYVTSVGGDAFYGYRFFVPVLPALFALAVAGIQSYAAGAQARLAACAILIAATPLLLPNRWIDRAPAFATSLAPSYGDVGNLQIGLWLRDHTRADASVADYWAGTVFYYSGRRGVDLLGKMDPAIARMPARCPAGVPGHTKYDFAHSLRILQPDYVVAGFKVDDSGNLSGPSGEPIARDGSPDPCAIFAALAHDEDFRRVYRHNVATNRFWRTVFAAREPSP